VSTVIVTGGTGALGRVVVERLLAEGFSVAVPFRDPAGWKHLRTQATSERLWGAAADAADPAAMVAFAADTEKQLGALSGLANLAGGYAGSPRFESAPPDEWDDMMRLNLGTAYAACRAVLPRLAVGGSIALVASRLVEQGGAGAVSYTVSKAGVVALARALAAENVGVVRVNCVLPGIIDTEANRAAMPEADVSIWTTPLAIAELIAFLLSPRSAALSGALLPLVGSKTAG
jgi:NAD(P)-dependent dehydrogenase (short-subunit alcohol dehydrogenase family)